MKNILLDVGHIDSDLQPVLQFIIDTRECEYAANDNKTKNTDSKSS